jgi:hypothetical protein
MVPYVLPLPMVEMREYLDRAGHSPFSSWFGGLNQEAAAKVSAALARMQQGNFSNARGAGTGFSSTASISVPATGFTSARMVTGL